MEGKIVFGTYKIQWHDNTSRSLFAKFQHYSSTVISKEGTQIAVVRFFTTCLVDPNAILDSDGLYCETAASGYMKYFNNLKWIIVAMGNKVDRYESRRN